MNPALVLTMNNVALTKRCLASLREQDIPVFTDIIDNGSTDGTADQLFDYIRIRYPYNKGVSRGWNDGLDLLFSMKRTTHVLVAGNDTVLGPWTYRHLLSYDLPFVTGVAVGNMEQLVEPTYKPSLEYHPDFSLFCIRRDCWETVGPFDENMVLYASDCDFHIRAHRLGVRLHKACVPYYHERSSTLRLASPEDRVKIETQANKDRAFLYQKWGCVPGSPSYDAMFRDDLFGVDSPSSRKVLAQDSTSSIS